MYKFLTKNGELLAFGLGTLFVVITFISIFSGVEEFNMLAKEDQGTTSIFNFGLGISIAITILCVVAMVVFGIIQMAGNIRGSLMGLASIGALVIIFIIAYSTATADTTGPLAKTISKFAISEGISKYVSAAISTSLALLGIASFAFVFSEIRNFFK